MEKVTNYLRGSILLLAVILTSCQQEDVVTPLEKQLTNNLQAIDQKEGRIMMAKLLARAMNDEQVRSFFKEEANRQIDQDYDILLALVKDKPISDDGQTLGEYLGKLHGDDEEVANMLRADPLLTLLVPRLTDIGFSAEEWQTDRLVPGVAIRDLKSADKTIHAFLANGTRVKLSLEETPSEPFLVLKGNERIVVSDQSDARVNAQQQIATVDGLSFQYADPAYKPRPAGGEKNAREINQEPVAAIDPKIMRAFEIERKYPGFDERIHIYYGIDPDHGVYDGYLSAKHEEAITKIQLASKSTFDRINEIEDWTDGGLEIHVTVIFHQGSPAHTTTSEPGGVGAEIFDQVTNVIPVRREDLLDGNGKPKPYVLPQPQTFGPWDYPYQDAYWQIACYEYDPETVTTKTIEVETSSSTGFGITLGPISIRLFGRKKSETTKKTVLIYNGPDDLGDAPLFWDRPVIKNLVTLPDGTPGVETSYVNTGDLILDFRTIRTAQ
jgi:hypothetical protein